MIGKYAVVSVFSNGSPLRIEAVIPRRSYNPGFTVLKFADVGIPLSIPGLGNLVLSQLMEQNELMEL